MECSALGRRTTLLSLGRAFELDGGSNGRQNEAVVPLFMPGGSENPGDLVMLRNKKRSVLTVVGLMAVLATQLMAVDRTRSSRTATSKAKPQQQSIAEAELALPDDSVLGENHLKNLETLQREKAETLRHRLEVLTKAFSVGRASQSQLDHAMLDQLYAELDTQDQPALRIPTLKKIIVLRQKIEEEAKQAASSMPAKPSDINPWLSAHGRYVNAKLGRINAQMLLEREQLAEEAAKTDPSKSETLSTKPK